MRRRNKLAESREYKGEVDCCRHGQGVIDFADSIPSIALLRVRKRIEVIMLNTGWVDYDFINEDRGAMGLV